MLADAVQNALRPSQLITWSRADGAPEDLTGATLTGVIRDQRTGIARPLMGALAVTGGPLGVFQWAYALADVAVAGGFDVQFTATFVAAPTPARSVAGQWTVREAL